MRKRSQGGLEMADEHGRRKTIQLEELSAADRALAEQFGYKPVSGIQGFPKHDRGMVLIQKTRS